MALLALIIHSCLGVLEAHFVPSIDSAEEWADLLTTGRTSFRWLSHSPREQH
jgi:hypothetical protein